MVKIAFVPKVVTEGDSVRGIGVHTNELVKALLKHKTIEILNEPKNADIVHYTKFNPFFISLPFIKPSKKLVLTIHDLIPLIYPTHYPSGIRGRIKFEINKYLVKKYVDRIITISETSKKDICRFLDVDPQIVDVVYIAPKSAIKKLKKGSYEKEIIKKYNLPDKFVLFDHGVNYNKNVPALIMACRKARVKLAMVGKETENIGKLDLNHAELRHLKGVDFSDVLRLGYVSDEDLNKLFNIATVCAQPSFYEGFGMPVVEAMTVGCPVIASRTQVLVEVGGDACLYFDPNSVDDLATKLKLLTTDSKTRNEYVKKGYEQVKKYSWQKTAQETLDAYAKA